MNIYVGNLSFKAGEDELKSLFEPYGEVVSAKVITDRETGRSRGFGFVEMEDDADARAAIEKLHQSEFMTRSLIVNEARARRTNNSRQYDSY